ncbi:MAG: hypothetical protein HZA66_19015 [Rhodopseudomonas palustris]|jgi:hypothetical protein|uniref:Uncharacterized protein n=1 Tax=Rhodopseudomonas palustris TaxID=1076 RepID=A0A933S1V0_RHOPL|nr:hypothetical protein [Rhodopseudomonas palustris]
MGLEDISRAKSAPVFFAAALYICAANFGLLIPTRAAASFATENPWAAEHLEKLPPDIRREVSRRERACGSGALAGHYFAVSIESRGQRFVSLHFEDFSCANRESLCRGNACLHEVFAESGGQHRVVFSGYAEDVRMNNDRGTVGLEVSLGGRRQALVWEGRRFVPARRSNGY